MKHFFLQCWRLYWSCPIFELKTLLSSLDNFLGAAMIFSRWIQALASHELNKLRVCPFHNSAIMNSILHVHYYLLHLPIIRFEKHFCHVMCNCWFGCRHLKVRAPHNEFQSSRTDIGTCQAVGSTEQRSPQFKILSQSASLPTASGHARGRSAHIFQCRPTTWHDQRILQLLLCQLGEWQVRQDIVQSTCRLSFCRDTKKFANL